MYFLICSLKEYVVERNTIWPCPAFTAPSVHCIWSPGYWDMRHTVVEIPELPFPDVTKKIPLFSTLHNCFVFVYILAWFNFVMT